MNKTIIALSVLAAVGVAGFIAWNKYKSIPGSHPNTAGGTAAAPGNNPAQINTGALIGNITNWGTNQLSGALNNWLNGG